MKKGKEENRSMKKARLYGMQRKRKKIGGRRRQGPMGCRGKRKTKKMKEEEEYNKTRLSKLGRLVVEPIFQNSLNVLARINAFFRNRVMAKLKSRFLVVRKTLFLCV